jgi:hypothetical protein
LGTGLAGYSCDQVLIDDLPALDREQVLATYHWSAPAQPVSFDDYHYHALLGPDGRPMIQRNAEAMDPWVVGGDSVFDRALLRQAMLAPPSRLGVSMSATVRDAAGPAEGLTLERLMATAARLGEQLQVEPIDSYAQDRWQIHPEFGSNVQRYARELLSQSLYGIAVNNPVRMQMLNDVAESIQPEIVTRVSVGPATVNLPVDAVSHVITVGGIVQSEGHDYVVNDNGTITFREGCQPRDGEVMHVTYRTEASVQAERQLHLAKLTNVPLFKEFPTIGAALMNERGQQLLREFIDDHTGLPTRNAYANVGLTFVLKTPTDHFTVASALLPTLRKLNQAKQSTLDVVTLMDILVDIWPVIEPPELAPQLGGSLDNSPDKYAPELGGTRRTYE